MVKCHHLHLQFWAVLYGSMPWSPTQVHHDGSLAPTASDLLVQLMEDLRWLAKEDADFHNTWQAQGFWSIWEETFLSADPSRVLSFTEIAEHTAQGPHPCQCNFVHPDGTQCAFIARTKAGLSAHLKKHKKYLGRREIKTAEKHIKKTPKYNLAPVIKDRYPTFVDALRDLDDALCLISLYAQLPQHLTLEVSKAEI